MKQKSCAIIKDYANARLITFCNPDALNAMTLPMMRDLYRGYVSAPHSNRDAIYILQGVNLKSFCAGGDILALIANRDGHNDEYYWREYQVCNHMGTMKNTQVSLWGGHVLGSGVGVSIHGKFRVACETTRFAMPETQIGAAPDVGTSWLFSRLPIKGLGAYLAITGNALRGADSFHAGIATHYVPSSALSALATDLCETRSSAEVEGCIRKYVAAPPRFTLAPSLDTLAKAFAITDSTTIPEIEAKLKADGSPFALMTLDTMRSCSPTGMYVALENYKMQRSYTTLTDALRVDYKVIQSNVLEDEFRIGVKARMVTNTKDVKWSVASVEDVSISKIRASLNPVDRLFDPTDRTTYPNPE